MKIRDGFVSNSSSSSFVLVVTEKGFQELKDHMENAWQRLALDKSFTSGTLGDNQIYTYTDATDREGNGPNDYWVDDTAKVIAKTTGAEVDDVKDFLNDLRYLRKQLTKGEFFISSIDW